MEIVDCRVYMPAKDFEASKRFYRELGFAITEGFGGTADLTLGAAHLRLQDYYVADWANNFMIKIGVEDARAWHRHVEAMVASGAHPGARVKPPEDVAGHLVTHVIDPSGVLLVFVERVAP